MAFLSRSKDSREQPPSDPAWLRYLYERHSPDELARWARSLRYFRFCRALGGFANDGDTLALALRFQDEGDLLALLSDLRISIQRYGPGTPQPIPGRAYSSEEFQRFPTLVNSYPSIGQPSHVELFGIRCHVWITTGEVAITTQSPQDVWEVDEAAVEGARTLEPHLRHLSDRMIDPPVNSRNCICPRYYPHLWGTSFAGT